MKLEFLKKTFLFMMVLAWFGLSKTELHAQNKYELSGTVMHLESGEPIEMVVIQLKETLSWTVSDKYGNFRFRDVPEGTFTLQTSRLGYEKYELPITINRDITNLKLKLKELSLGLEEVVVVAKENSALSSSSKIERSALDHIQPNTIGDLMQLVPGQITVNPDLSAKNQITIRDINTPGQNPDANSSLGTSIIIDGTPLSNDANMQTLNTSSGGISQSYSSAGQGVDLRQIPVDQIESVEVIRGIPSAQYGDLTSGALIVKTKAGEAPLNVKLKSDINIKQLAISKGLLIPKENWGAVNIDLDYLNAVNDLRTPTKSFKRITGQLSYSNIIAKNSTPLTINAKLSIYSTIDNEKEDEDAQTTELYKNKEQNINFKLFGKWATNLSWLNSITYNISGSFEKQDYYEYKITSGASTPTPKSWESGESIGVLLPTSYFSELTIDGRPFSYFANLKTTTSNVWGNLISSFYTGIDYRVSGNNGLGKLYDLATPPFGGTSTRPRAFNEIPNNDELSVFVEEKLQITLGTTTLQTQAGFRYNNFLPKGLFSTKGYQTFEPRINTNYILIKKRRKGVLRNLELRAGYGVSSKSPSMIYLYPDKSYKDEISFNYYPDLYVFTTLAIDDMINPELQPASNRKLEVGIDINIQGVNLKLTAFKEHLTNGFSWNNQYTTMNFRKWAQLDNTDSMPEFVDGDIYYTTPDGSRKILDYTWQQEFSSYKKPQNTYETKKKGLEYIIDFGRIKPIRSSVILDGAYFHITRTNNNTTSLERINTSYLGDRFPYLPVYAGNDGYTKQRLNSNLRINTHIPKIKMICSLTGMFIWHSKSTRFWNNHNNTPLYYSLDDMGNKQYGVTNGEDMLYIDPIGYYDFDMNYHSWDASVERELPYKTMIKQRRADFFNMDKNPPTWQLNMKLTKEIGKHAKISFFANNILNHRPLRTSRINDTYYRANQPTYFGAEVKLTI